MSTHTDLHVHIYAVDATRADTLRGALDKLRLAPDADADADDGMAGTWTGASWPDAIDEAISALEDARATFHAFEAGTHETLPTVAWGAPGHTAFSAFATVDGEPLIPLSTFEALATVTGTDVAFTAGAAVRAAVHLAKQATTKEN